MTPLSSILVTARKKIWSKGQVFKINIDYIYILSKYSNRKNKIQCE